MVEFSEQLLAGMTDMALVKKIYRLGQPEKGGTPLRRRRDGGVEGTPGDGTGEMEREEVEVAVLGLMALRGAV